MGTLVNLANSHQSGPNIGTANLISKILE